MKRGISLIEILFVLVLIAVVIVLYESNLRSIIEEHKAKTTAQNIEKDLESLSQMATGYYVKKGLYPPGGWSNDTIYTNFTDVGVMKHRIQKVPKRAQKPGSTDSGEYVTQTIANCCEGGGSCVAFTTDDSINDLTCRAYNYVVNQAGWTKWDAPELSRSSFCMSASIADPDKNKIVKKLTCN